MQNILNILHQDVLFYHQLRFPGKKPTFPSLAMVLLRSRGLLIVAAHRISHGFIRSGSSGAVAWIQKQAVRIMAFLGTYLSIVLAKSNILDSTEFEPAIYLSDRGHIILGARSIGTGTIIHDHVTIGMNLINMGIPEIGRNVWIGPHSIINGDIKIGDGVTVLPNTVLTKSLPPGVVVQGNPARIVRRDFDNSMLRQSSCSDIGNHMNKDGL